ncbi:MAG: hypothetical protein ABRQ26_10325 [Syntrophomonadaceae bacterium]
MKERFLKKEYLYMLLIAIALQIGVYYYVDQVVLLPAASFSQEAVLDVSKLPANPAHVSYDKKYYVEMQSQGVVFYQDNNIITEIPIKEEDRITDFSWVPETHLALIAISGIMSDDTTLSLKIYDVENDRFIQEQQIIGVPSDSKIVAAVYSSQFNVSYVLVKDNKASSIYRTAKNNFPVKLSTSSPVSQIALLPGTDILLFDNQDTYAIYTIDEKSKQKMISPREEQYALIGTDRDSNIYIGQLTSEGLISTILKGTLDGGFTEVQPLENPYPVASVTVSYDGKLAYN